MPFKSEAQRRLCWAKKARGEAGSWDCKEWESKTKKKKQLPYKVSEARLIAKIDKAIAEMKNQALGSTGKPKLDTVDLPSNTVKREKKKSRTTPSDSTTQLLHRINTSLKKAK